MRDQSALERVRPSSRQSFFSQLRDDPVGEVAEAAWRVYDVHRHTAKRPDQYLLDVAVRSYPIACEKGFFGTVAEWLAIIENTGVRLDRTKAPKPQ